MNPIAAMTTRKDTPMTTTISPSPALHRRALLLKAGAAAGAATVAGTLALVSRPARAQVANLNEILPYKNS